MLYTCFKQLKKERYIYLSTHTHEHFLMGGQENSLGEIVVNNVCRLSDKITCRVRDSLKIGRNKRTHTSQSIHSSDVCVCVLVGGTKISKFEQLRFVSEQNEQMNVTSMCAI